MSDARTNAVLGNFIGTDATGSNAVPNAAGGIHMDLCVGPVIGGAAPGAGNVIAGNGGDGISFTRGSNLQIDGNFIGTDLTGTLDLGNGTHGINCGGPTCFQINIGVGAPNTIAFNGTALGHAGIALSSGVISNNITGNLIYTNAGPGVFLFQGATQTRISDNSIFDNGHLGILIGFAINPNDPCDTDVGDNDLQNFPVLTAATSTVNSVTIAGFLPSAPSTTFDLEFFANTVCDPSGFGEGELFLGTTNVTTGANCTNNFTVTFPVGVANAMLITATATDPDGNTSEFSQCLTNQALITCSQSESTNDVWDVGNGTIILTSSGQGAGDLRNMFGGLFPSAEPRTAFFDDSHSAGFVHFVEWQTPTPVVVTNFNLISYHTATNDLARAFSLFNLYGFNPSNSTFELLFTLTPPLPYGQDPDGRFLYACGPLPPLATDKFRAEFVQAINGQFAGPRVIELDGFGITLSTNTSPQITCPANITTNTAAGTCARFVAFNATATGTPTPLITYTTNGVAVTSPVTFPKGVTTVSATASNVAGTDQCAFTVTVNDEQLPLITCHGDVTTNVSVGVTSAVVFFQSPTIDENCSFIAFTGCSMNSGDTFPLGTTPVTCLAIDGSANTNQCTFNVIVQETAPATHDLALIKLHAVKNVNLKGAEPSLTKFVKVTLQNRSPHDEAITDLTGLVTLVAESLSNVCPNATVVLHNGPPNKTKTLKPKQKLTVTFDVIYNCANDPLKGEGHEDFRYLATVHHSAIDGIADTHTADDNCPRVPLPGGVDNVAGLNIKDTGCAGGVDVKTDVFIKQ